MLVLITSIIIIAFFKKKVLNTVFKMYMSLAKGGNCLGATENSK